MFIILASNTGKHRTRTHSIASDKPDKIEHFKLQKKSKQVLRNVTSHWAVCCILWFLVH